MAGGRKGLVQYLKLSKGEEEEHMVVERMKAKHNRAVWQRVTGKQIRKTRFEDFLDISNLVKNTKT